MSDDYRKIQGRIFDIQKYSIHDGPGIRTIVFLKGCPLRCKWCCNPESQIRDIQIMVQGGKEKTVGRDVSVEEVMEEVMKDSAYYRRSGGGLTLSGGECLLQPDFAGALLRAAKENGSSKSITSPDCSGLLLRKDPAVFSCTLFDSFTKFSLLLSCFFSV